MADHRGRYKGKDYKDPKEIRRRREEGTIQLRKQKRDDEFIKKRTLLDPLNDNSYDVDPEDPNFDDAATLTDSEANKGSNQLTVDMYRSIIQNEDMDLVLENAQKVRKILSKEPHPPFDDVIESNLMTRFMELLQRHDLPDIQFEIAWILTNICSGTTKHTLAVVDKQAVPVLVNLCASPVQKVREQAVWALGNIIGEGPKLRDLVIEHQFVPHFLKLLKPDVELEFLRNLTWVIVNLTRANSPPPETSVIESLLEPLSWLIQSCDIPVLIDTVWALSYINEMSQRFAKLTISKGILQHLCQLLSHDEVKIQTAVIRTLGSIATGTDELTQAIIDAGALPRVHELMSNRKSERIIKEALWFLSNITAGSTDQIQAVIDNGLIPKIIFHLADVEFAQQKEACWAVFNMCLSGSPSQLRYLTNYGVIPPLCDLLNIRDMNLLRNTLEAIELLLAALHKTDPDLVLMIEECGGLDKIENLMNHEENQEVHSLAFGIIIKYFPDQEAFSTS